MMVVIDRDPESTQAETIQVATTLSNGHISAGSWFLEAISQ